MLNTHLFKSFTLFFFLLTANVAFGQTAYKVKDIPDPKKNGGGYVSDPDLILGDGAVSTLNGTITQFEHQTNVQVAVVIVNDFDHDKEDFDFAYALFNTWGIGSKTSNNGLLLFISKDRRKYRFITGTGIEGVLPDVKLKHIAEQNLLPAFRQNDFSTGITNTINAIGVIILNPEHKSELNQFFTQRESNSSLENFWLPTGIIILAFWGVFKIVNRQAKNGLNLKAFDKKSSYDTTIAKGCGVIFFLIIACIFVLVFTGAFDIFRNIKLAQVPYILFSILAIGLFFRYLFYISQLRKAHQDDKNFFDSVVAFHKKNWWLVLFSPIILIAIIIHLIKRVKTIDRFKPILDSKNNPMIRVDRDINIEGEPFLTPGQRKEEVVKAYDYDIWESADDKEHIIKTWPAEEYNGYTECPECNFRTYKLNKRVTVKQATYSHAGQAKLINECSFCKKTEFIKWITLAMLVESSSSSSSSSSGSSSSSSSSSSSWGGGSSSGGGTGGSW
ncbi:TPM domain-containing protein [Pedobacter psychrodurus]|uniref:TPM domain-containing protein n=1 Tax=Pedobacter psychrodurus TaxID=2530456 RepID=UPI0029309594|nr:TPM domain-containing protein [Pedobacter psychrodurus]